MTTIDIIQNFNGKLFADIFSHVTLFSQEFKDAWSADEDVKIITRSTDWGMAKILHLSKFPFRDLKNSVSYLNIGRSAVAQAFELNRMHNQGRTLPPDTMLCHLVLGFTERNMENQNILIKAWWEAKQLNNAIS